MDLPKFRFISSEVGIYLYYAGRGRQFMALSRATERVFLDLPGFLTSEGVFEDDGRIIQSLNRADAVRRYLREPINVPRPQGLASYSRLIPQVDGRTDRSFVADLGNIRTMFVDLGVGDLVIMTPQNHYDPLLIGEVTSRWHPEHVMTLPDQSGHELPYREVHWLSHGLARRDFPANVAQRMQNRKAITKIDSETYEAIFKLVYHSYVWGNTSKIDIFAPEYNSNDPTSTAEASGLVKYAVALAIAFEIGEISQFYSLSIDAAVNQYFKTEYIVQISQSFGSPGGYISRLIGTAAAIAVAGTLTYALSDEGQQPPQVGHHIAQQIDQIASQPGAASDRAKLLALGDALRAGNPHDIRAKYGRAAKAKLGLTLHGQQSPEITAPDRVRP